MVWFFSCPHPPRAWGISVARMIGARDVAFPRINLAKWYYSLAAECRSVAIVSGGIDRAEILKPYSSTYGTVRLAMAAGISCGSSVPCHGAELSSIHTMRAPGLTGSLPLVSGRSMTPDHLVLATRLLALPWCLLGMERGLGIGLLTPLWAAIRCCSQSVRVHSHPAVTS